jgi:oxaloacetate decarboxylase gamma subunit
VEDLISGAVELLTLGMSTVFVFLGVLVAATMVMSKVLQNVGPPPPPAAKPAKRQAVAARGLDARRRMAIELAIARYRREH